MSPSSVAAREPKVARSDIPIPVTMKGMCFAILGRKFQRPRHEIVALIEARGGRVAEKVTNKVNNLLIGFIDLI